MTYSKKQQAANRKKWLTALRSGEYKQTKHHLHDKIGYCCLGVACELAIKAGVEITRHEGVGAEGCTTFSGNDGILPSQVQDWLGLRNSDGAFDDDGDKDRSLASLNDSGKTFKQIATIFEKNVKKLVV